MTTQQHDVLIALKAFHFLTAEQLSVLGLFNTAKQARDRALTALKKKKIITVSICGIEGQKGGRLPSIYHLKKQSMPLIPHIHMTLIQDVAIALHKAEKYYIKDFETYFFNDVGYVETTINGTNYRIKPYKKGMGLPTEGAKKGTRYILIRDSGKVKKEKWGVICTPNQILEVIGIPTN